MENLKFENLPSAVGQLNNKLDRIERLLTEKVNPQKNELDELLTVEQCAKFLNLKKPTIYGLISKRELPVLKRSKRCYFLKEDLIIYLKEGRRKTITEIQAEANQYLVKKKGRKK